MNQNLNDLKSIIDVGYILYLLKVIHWEDYYEWTELYSKYTEIRLRSVETID